jgi:thiol-disulfide isomerase/thioredoxin
MEPMSLRRSRLRRAGPALRVLGLALLAAALVAGCGKPKQAKAPGPPETAASAEPGSGKPGSGEAGSVDVQPATVEQVQQAIHAPGSKAVLVNVWATWCAPCREEFPDLMRIRKEYREWGLRLVLVSADADTAMPAVRRFLEAEGVTFLTYLKQGSDMPFIDGLDSLWSGALPATLLYDGAGNKKWFHEGKTSYDTLQSRIDALLAPAASRAP